MSDISKINLAGTSYNIKDETARAQVGALANIPANKNGIYRGKNLGTITSANIGTFLEAHKVASGEFEDLFLGDYFTIQDGTYNAQWQIAGFDTYLRKGDQEMVSHHVSLIPRGPLTSAQMNSSNVTTGGFQGSAMFTSVLPTVNSNMAKALGSHLLTRRALLSNSVNTTAASGAGAGWQGSSNNWSWVDVKACLMSEVEVYGSVIAGSSIYDVGEACEKLPLFNFINHVQAVGRSGFWLRAVSTSAAFASAHSHGDSGYSFASTSLGVVPLICLG